MYGHVRFRTFWNSLENERTLASGQLEDDTDLDWSLNTGGSRFGVDFKQGDLSAKIEIRPQEALLRVWSATWNFGAGKFLIGHDYTPAWKSYSVAAEVSTGAYGNTGASVREALLQWSFPLGPGTLEIAGVEPDTDAAGVITNFAEVDVVFPKLEASYDVKFGPTHWYPYVGWQTYDEVDTSNREESVTSWTLGLYGSAGFGAFTINGGAYYAQNYAEYGNSAGRFNVSENASGGLDDTKTWGAGLSAVWVINDIFRLQGGYHYLESEPDDGTESQQTRSAYYLNAPIYVTKNMTITPEVGVQDEGDTTSATGVETETPGSKTVIGARWVVTF
jgi:hypothetical protein